MNLLINTWATRCDGDVECYDGLDEHGCDTSLTILIMISLVTIILLLALFLFGHISISDFAKVDYFVKCEAQNEQMNISILIEMKNADEINAVYENESEKLGSKENAMCYFKVSH